ncbi:MAG: hypothetical protein QOE36_1044 [Gaiellaceae bacterium]|nr:hypothetical protein [Gaiellaceae bacterium]
MLRRAATILLLAVLVAGCSGSSASPKLKSGDLAKLVLQPSDLSKVFDRFDEGRQIRADFHPGPRAKPDRFGRQDGWKARYKRAGGATTPGPLVIESRADVFGDSGGAKKDLDAYAEEFSGTGGARPVDAPKLGDGSRAFEIGQGTATSGVTYYLIAWRDGRFTASLNVSGFTGRVTFADALALARKQEAHLAAAR